MTEKQYGGSTGRGAGEKSTKANMQSSSLSASSKQKRKEISAKPDKKSSSKEQKILEAGKIAKKVSEYAKTIIKPNMKLLEIAEKIEDKIFELGGEPAFPVNLSINEVAAHYTPSYNDEAVSHGLLKVDLGVHIDGYIADTAFSVDLEASSQNKKLIEASDSALNNAIETAKENISVSEIGRVIQKTIESLGFSPIINLSGHEMEQYDLHTGITIPNIDDNRNDKLQKGLYAIEPFATTGNGKIREGKPSEIYELINPKNVRSQFAREVLDFIESEYATLPFCSRWIVKKFGTRALFGLRELENNENLHRFPELIEISKAKVSQAEHTILIGKEKIIVTTN